MRFVRATLTRSRSPDRIAEITSPDHARHINFNIRSHIKLLNTCRPLRRLYEMSLDQSGRPASKMAVRVAAHSAGCARNAATTCKAVPLPYCDNAERTGAASLLRPGTLCSKPLQIVGRRRPIYLGALLDLLVAGGTRPPLFARGPSDARAALVLGGAPTQTAE